MLTYDGLERILKEKGLTKTALTKLMGLSSRTVAKINRAEKIAPSVLNRIAAFLGCGASLLCREVPDNPVLRILREEKDSSVSGGLYHELQVRMTYNSNHIEGSRLSEDQTRMIFETNTVDAGDGIPVDDILETVNHFRAVDYVIDVASEPLSEEIVKKLHFILKSGTSDSRLKWFATGDWKRRPNMVGGKETAKPSDVPRLMENLISDYNSIKTVTINDIIAFHASFEFIHPFQDGNGRVGRLIALKECLHHNIIPFIIEDSKKNFYYRGLDLWKKERGWLTDTCLDGQDTFKALLETLGVPVTHD